MKTVVCLIMAVYACFCSAFAWNAESFISDGLATYQPYVLAPVEDPALDPAQVPMLMSLNDGIAVAFEDGVTGYASGYDDAGAYKEVDWTTAQVTFGSNHKSNQRFQMVGVYDYKIVTGPLYDDIAGTMQSILDDAEASVYMPESSTYYSWRTASTVLSSDFPSTAIPDSEYVDYVRADSASWRFDLDVDGSSSTMDFSVYIPTSFIRLYYQGVTDYFNVKPNSLRLYVNDVLQRTYPFTVIGANGKIDVAGEIINVNEPITSAYVVIDAPTVDYWGDIPINSNTNYIWWSYFHKTSFIKYSLITSGALDGVNAESQDKINEHESIESEWTGSMTENFNALDLGSFSYPDGLVAAFALITGIFNDLWNGMGEYKILYVFPLTLGVVLLLIGRISKFSGRGSSARSGKGDDSA